MGPDRPNRGSHFDGAVAGQPFPEPSPVASVRVLQVAGATATGDIGLFAAPDALDPVDDPLADARAGGGARGRERGGTDRMSDLSAFLRGAAALRASSERGRAMLWSRHVNRPVGAWIAYALLRTRVTPNMVSVAGCLIHLLGALVVVTSPVPVSPAVAVVAFASWELALALDNADGLLARARDTASPFGAWFDQILDFVNHTAVIAALVAVAAQAVPLSAPQAAILGTLALAGNLVLLFASAQRNALLGTQPALGNDQMARLRPLLVLRNLTDYGAFIAAASLGLLWPPLLIVALVVSSAMSAGLVAVQVAINWPRG